MMIFTRFNLQLNSISSRNSFQERRFLLVTGLGYQLLGVILETGGCTAEASDIVKPDPFYVDQALNTLEHLRSKMNTGPENVKSKFLLGDGKSKSLSSS